MKKIFKLSGLQHLKIAGLVFLLSWPMLSTAELLVSYRAPDSDTDKRQEYNIHLLTLLMEKTTKEYGSYKFVPTPPMNSARALYALSLNVFPNFVTELTYTDSLAQDNQLDFIPIPIDFGIIGYRICFVSPMKKNEISQVRSLSDLKKYVIGQGTGWPDKSILEYNGFKVVEQNNYDSLFKLVASGRIDLFCRGINELPLELIAFKHIQNLTYDTSFALAYPLPRFLFFKRGATELKSRLGLGLKKSLADGSLKELWREQFIKYIEFAALPTRKIYFLDNPMLKELDPHYKQYNMDPLKLN